MEDDYGNDSTTVDTAKAERSVWLMKCPPVVSKAWQSSAAAAEAPPVAKVVVSLDPLRAEDPSALQVNQLPPPFMCRRLCCCLFVFVL
ncbi:UNVERIFIED_CONTAM: hypothetical protein Sradi_3746200 [Sesamum radiatum]|uniref:TFIIF beta subunit N-terminal domain-containing protein n=1 Tax=Sesamum radiatum TaxID=300843 RepID=A0AAW2PYS9_SESRA